MNCFTTYHGTITGDIIYSYAVDGIPSNGHQAKYPIMNPKVKLGKNSFV